MCISHAINIKNYSLKNLIEHHGVMQVQLVCPPPVHDRDTYESITNDVFIPLSTHQLECIQRPVRTRTKRGGNTNTITT
jgi:hypothetical protein